MLQRIEKGLVRCDFDKVYCYDRYNEAINYGRKNNTIVGVDAEVQKLNRERKTYERDIKAIVDAEKEMESKKYLSWKKFFDAKQICKWLVIGDIGLLLVHFVFLDSLVSSLFRHLKRITILYELIIFLAMITILAGIPIFIVLKLIEIFYAKGYQHYISRILSEINKRNHSFEETSKYYYNRIDNLYLSALDPAMREVILLRREQEAHQEEMKRIAIMQLEEAERGRRAQEEQLKIEQERERRYQESIRKW
jgi:hypothetical protein